MPTITLPDGSTRSFAGTTSADAIALDISEGLLKCAIGTRINGELCDLNTPITCDAEVRIVTATKGEKESDPDALMLIRHSCAHVMAEAIQRIRPEAQLVYGPSLENGFYYDIAFDDASPLSSDELIAKFRSNIAYGGWGKERGEQLLDFCVNIEGHGDLNGLADFRD